MMEHETKRTIIDRALSLFREFGYDKVTVQQICNACGITKTTFYYHLSSKAEIITDLYRPVAARLSERMDRILSAGNYWEQFVEIFNQSIDVSEEIGRDLLGQRLILNLREDHGVFQVDQELAKTAALLIEQAQKVGQIRNQSPALSLYYAADYLYRGFELQWCISGTTDRKRQFRRMLENVFDVTPILRRSPLY